ncbi:phosphoadenosine phosphosulfate reductase [Frigidibacter sp. MR17.14]|uniref:phosphoadenosine phosphosulfate reductase n=1 Tax=Frigidibacter sp. MR17.14 TaxID=3126509 RepID=UPI003012FA29
MPQLPIDPRQAEIFERLDAFGEDAGYFEPLGPRHGALFCDEGTTLLVTFETLDACKGDPDGRPMGQRIAARHGWSSLSLIADGPTWFRDRAVFGFFDRQVDDAFFEDFDRVIFWGAGMCGYAAAAFSVTAPGATVILAAPQATLDPAVTGWDGRFARLRRMNFTDRYGYAPDMIEGAGPVYVIYDPLDTADAMHASLFTRPFVQKLPCPFIGRGPARMLADMGLIEPLLEAAAADDFSAADFWRLYRARRSHRPWLRRFAAVLEQRERPVLSAIVNRNAGSRLGDSQFRSRFKDLSDEIAGRGGSIPPARRPAERPAPVL